MADPQFFIKRNDTVPYLDAALQDDRGRPINLTSTTVLFHMRDTADDSVKISGAAVTVLSATRGEVRYTWTSNDTDTAGNYEGEFQVTFDAGGVHTFPNNGYINIIMLEDVV